MMGSTHPPVRALHLKRIAFFLAAAWTMAVSLGTVWDLRNRYKDALESARLQAAESFEKDLVYQRWADDHGGVYVPVTQETPPNPYLSHVKNRDVTTTSGLHLTLMNPACMTRQMQELGRDLYGHQGHMTSLKPIRPENAPDAWEADALRAFERGKTEVAELKKIGDKDYLRLMRPLLTEARCLKCHEEHGYKVGDLRGGISESVPMAPLWALMRRHMAGVTLGYGVIWLLGLGGIRLSASHLRRRISERDRAEEALRLTRYSIDRTKAAIYWMGADGRFTDVNETACRVLGYTRAELLAMTIHDIDLGLPAERWAAHWAELEEHGALLFESTHRAKDGRVFPVEISANHVIFEGRQLSCALATDITDRRRAEVERERLSTAIEQAGEIVVVTDPEGTIEYVNPAFEAATGYSRDEAIGQNPRILKSGAQDDAFYRELWETITSGRTWEGRMVNRRKDETLYTEEATISPVLGPSGRIVNYVAVKRDITKHLQLEARLQQSQRMESIGRLAGGVAHDFNNILTGISGFTEFALTTAPADWPLREDLAEVLKLSKRAANLTYQLLAFSRRQTLQPAVLELNELVGDMAKMLRELIGEDIDLVFVPAENLGEVKADPGQIEQVVMNLALNARDAMPDGGKLTIETANVALDEEYASTHHAVTPGEYIMVAITDTGCGMDESVRERLFEPFFTTKDKGKGTGLGLATVYGIVKQHGGNIWVYSERGTGTTFKVYLPRVAEAAKAKEPAPPVESLSGTETLLVVEDEAAVLKTVERTLQARGYRIFAAGTPSEADAILAEHGADIALLLTDVVLPERNGRQLYESARERHAGLRVLYMSGYTENAIAHHGVLDPGTPFIQKPFTPSALAHKVREVLEGPAPGR